MPHPRKILRHQTATRLRLLPDFAQRVFPGRYLPLKADTLPAICVYTLRNSARREGAQTQPTFLDTCSLAIEVYLKGAAVDVEDQMDDVLDVIEHGLLCDATWRKDCGIEFIDGIDTQYKIDAKGEAPFMAAQLAVDVQYRTSFPPAGLTDFAGFRVSLAPIEPRDPNVPYPPEDWQLSPFVVIDVPQD